MLGQNQASNSPSRLGARVTWTLSKLAQAQTTKEFLKLLDCNLGKQGNNTNPMQGEYIQEILQDTPSRLAYVARMRARARPCPCPRLFRARALLHVQNTSKTPPEHPKHLQNTRHVPRTPPEHPACSQNTRRVPRIPLEHLQSTQNT